MAAFQQSGSPVSVPASPMYLHSSGVAQSTGQQAPSPSILAGQLEAINGEEITPYPGYIPPPPPSSPASEPSFPTLIGNSEDDLQTNGIIGQQGSRTLQQTPIQIVQQPDLACSGELTTFQNFLTCVKKMSKLTADEDSNSCSFDRQSSCRLHSKSLEWMIGSFSNADHYRTFATLASRPEQFHPTGNFAYFVEENGLPAEDEVALSTTIGCQKGNGVLKFDYWVVGDPEAVTMRVCTQDLSTRSCTQSITYGGQSSVSVEVVHPNSTSFDLEIVASNLVGPTILVFDNVEYSSEGCRRKEDESVKEFFDDDDDADNDSGEVDQEIRESPVEENQLLSIPNRPPTLKMVKKGETPEEEIAELDLEGTEHEAVLKELCQALDCNFDGGLCQYDNYQNSSMILGNWQVGNQKVGNPHTGIRDAEGGFMYVGTDSNSSQKILNYILESKELKVDHDFQLSLDIYRRSNDITFQVCLDTPFYCPYSLPPFEKDVFWQHDQVFLIPKGTRKLFLRAIQWRKFKWLAISKLKVVSDFC